MTLPKTIVFPSLDYAQKKFNSPQSELGRAVGYIHQSARAAGIEVIIDEKLEGLTHTCMPIIVDGTLAAIEHGDWAIPPACTWSGNYKCVFMFHHLKLWTPYKQLGSFPQVSFTDWDEYFSLSKGKFTAAGNLQHLQGCTVERRIKARTMLESNGIVFDKEIVSHKEFWTKSLNCLASLHIPGANEHCLDRGLIQMFGLGVCAISPDIWSSIGTTRPEPNVHYVGIKDDYSDLIDKIHWCEDNRDKCRQIGQNGKQLFLEHCVPTKIWSYIKERCSDDVKPIKSALGYYFL